MSLGIREILLRLHLCLINFVVILLQNLVFCRNLEQEAMNVSILILRVHFDFTPEFQLDFNRRYINEMEKRPDYIGYSIWNLVDFQVDGRGDSKPNLNQKGMLTEDRRKKEIYYYCQARWSDIPMIHIAGADWTKRVEICDDSINVRKISVFLIRKRWS